MINLPVSDYELVLEIGSGHNPHPRSDILVDRWLLNNQQRQRRVIRIDRPLVVADGLDLPFPDKSFDFILCNQVIEHIVNPERFIFEITRVGKRGLIIAPHILRERIFGWHYHKWFIDMDHNTLVFYPKLETQQTQFAHFIHMLYANNTNFRHFITKYDNMLNINYLWDREIKYRIANNSNNIVSDFDEKAGEFLQQITYSWKNIIYQLFREKLEKLSAKAINYYTILKRKQIRTSAWNDLRYKLKCIICHKPGLAITNKTFVCSSCGKIYKIKNDIPLFIKDSDF